MITKLNYLAVHSALENNYIPMHWGWQKHGKNKAVSLAARGGDVDI